MKKYLCSPLAALIIALSLAGCFGGEEEGSTPTNTGGTDTGGAVKKTLSPGLYLGDYAPYDSTGTLESEITLDAGGTFRFYWIISNEAIGDMRGRWFQRDSNLYFSSSSESFIEASGRFGPGEPIDDDTTSIRNVTDTSFTRMEYTLIRQKPFWITYRKKAIATVKAGTYVFTPNDTGKTQIKVSLSGADFLYSYKDTLDNFEVAAQWYQFGSIFGTEGNRGRSYIDSLKTFDAWDTIPGTILQRIRGVSDTAFEMWNASPRIWDLYRKAP